MDSSHLGLIHQYSTQTNLNASRPIPTRSQTSPQPPEFEFSLPSVSSVRPGLAKIGRRISEMSDNFLYEPDVNSEPLGRSMSVSRKGIPRIQEEKMVPFMGDEPVFCPFCEKPLPPGLLSSHGHHEEEARLTRTPVMGLAPNSVGMAKATSAPETSSSTSMAKPLMTPLPVTQPPSPAVVEPRVTSVELGKPVGVADAVDNAASKVSIETEDLRRWAKIAGIDLDLPPPPAEKIESTSEPAEPFPKLAPPPEDQSRGSARTVPKFGFFAGKSSEGEDEEESDDDMGGAGGYARLNGPASPETIEKDLAPLEHKERKADAAETEPAEQATSSVAETETPASEEEIRSILKDVLSRVNAMSKSHTAVLHSHSTILTTLKITRSNLAMAEANAEMLEEQLKRQSRQSTPVAPGRTSQPSNPMGPPAMPASKPPTRAPPPLSDIKTGSTSNSTGTTPASSARPSTESSRPQSIQIPNSNIPRTPMSASSESGKGVFGFWSRNKDKVGEFMANLPDLTPTAERTSYDFNRPIETPSASTSLVDRVMPGEPRAPGLNRSKTVHGRAGESDTLQRSTSYTGINVRNNVLREPAAPRQPMDPYTQELSRLRTAHSTAQGKIESMSKELAVLKKGKIDMEAELENLSQALFEEANKMVADERKARAELEESLKEVKDEREALRETIKVLGGQVEDKSSSQGDTDEEESEDVGKLPDFQPRDLDKHYEALRKSIHHVTDPQRDEEDDEEDESNLEGLAETTKNTESRSYLAPKRRHSLPGLASPEPPAAPALHDPWADNNSTSGLGTSAGTNHFEVGSMSSTGSRDESGSQSPGSRYSDSYNEQLRAEIELESPKREKIGL